MTGVGARTSKDEGTGHWRPPLRRALCWLSLVVFALAALPAMARAEHESPPGEEVAPAWMSTADHGLGIDEVGQFVVGSGAENVNNPDSIYTFGNAAKPAALQALGIRDLDTVVTAFDADSGAKRWSTKIDEGNAEERAAGLEVDGNDIFLYAIHQVGPDAVTRQLNLRQGEVTRTYRSPGLKINGSGRSVTTSQLTLAGRVGADFALQAYQTAAAEPAVPFLDVRPVRGEAFDVDMHHTWKGDIASWRTIVVTGREDREGLASSYTAAYRTDSGAKVWEQRFGSAGSAEGRVALSHYVASRQRGLAFISGRSRGADGTWDLFVTAHDLQTGAPAWTAGPVQVHAGAGDAEPVAMAYSDATETLYVTGTEQRGSPHGTDVVTVAYDALTGEQLGLAHASGDISNGTDRPTDIAVSADGSRVFVSANLHNRQETGGHRAGLIAYDSRMNSAGRALLPAGGAAVDRAGGLVIGLQDHGDPPGEAPTVLVGGSVDLERHTDMAAAAYRIEDFDVAAVPTQLRVDGSSARDGQHTDEVTVAFALSDADGHPVEGRSVAIDVAGEVTTAVTDADGVARRALRLSQPPGVLEVVAAFAGDGPLQPSSASLALEVLPEDSTMAVSVTGNGIRRSIEARLADGDDPSFGLADREVSLVVDGVERERARTDPEGRARFHAPPGTRGGSRTFEVRFGGDGLFLPSSGSATTSEG